MCTFTNKYATHATLFLMSDGFHATYYATLFLMSDGFNFDEKM